MTKKANKSLVSIVQKAVDEAIKRGELEEESSYKMMIKDLVSEILKQARRTAILPYEEYSRAQLAELLQTSKNALEKMAQREVGPTPYHLENGRVRYARADVQAYLKASGHNRLCGAELISEPEIQEILDLVARLMTKKTSN
jgi:polyhydroxyalkanoate synthesis regulator phasin